MKKFYATIVSILFFLSSSATFAGVIQRPFRSGENGSRVYEMDSCAVLFQKDGTEVGLFYFGDEEADGHMLIQRRNIVAHPSGNPETRFFSKEILRDGGLRDGTIADMIREKCSSKYPTLPKRVRKALAVYYGISGLQ